MLNKDDLRQFRLLRGLSYREVSNYCDVTHTMISEVEKGSRGLTKETHDQIVKGINLAYDAKLKGTLKAENTKKPKEKTEEEKEKINTVESVKKTTTRRATKANK